MTYRSLFILLVLPLVSTAQDNDISFGLKLGAGGQLWTQTRFNSVLMANSMPQTPKFSSDFHLGTFYRYKNFEIANEMVFLRSGKRSAADKLKQSFVLFDVNLKRHFEFKTVSLYPMAGLGVSLGKTSISHRSGATTLAAAFINRNTTSLYNQQGFAVVAAGLTINPKDNRKFINIEGGYRLGFAGENWSTDEETSNNMTNSTYDTIRQIYVRLTLGLKMRLKTKDEKLPRN